MAGRSVGALISTTVSGAGAAAGLGGIAGPSVSRMNTQLLHGTRMSSATRTVSSSRMRTSVMMQSPSASVRCLHQSSALRAGTWSDTVRNLRKRKNALYRQLGMDRPYSEDELEDMQKPEGVVPSVSTKLLKSQARKARKRYYKPINYIDSQGIVQRKETQHKYSTAPFKISNRKLKMLADQIGSGKPLDFAILQMQFSKKRAAKRIKSTLALAKDHAIAKGLDGKKLVVAEAWVNKHRTLKRLEIKGRGRSGVRKHKYCRLHIILREGLLQSQKDENKLKEVRRQAYSIGTGGVSPTNAPLRNQWKSPGWQW